MRVDNVNVNAINALKGVKTHWTNTPEEGTDAAVFSQRAKDIQTAFEALQAVPETRTEDVTILRAQIEEGTFEIDEDAIAAKLLEPRH